MGEVINLKEIMGTVYKNSSRLILITVSTVVLMAIYLWLFATPIYQNSTQLVINQQHKEELRTEDVQANLNLVDTYNTIIKSTRILTAVNNELDNRYQLSDLANQIQVASSQNSQVIDIRVENRNPTVAALIANTTAKVAQKEIPKIMGVNNVTILSEAMITKNAQPVRPRKTLMLVLALMLGLVLGLGQIALHGLFDKTIKYEQDLTAFGVNVLGSVSEIIESK